MQLQRSYIAQYPKIILALLTTVCFTFCKKSITPKSPPKDNESCDLQYTLSTWLDTGESIPLPTCYGSLTLTFLERNQDLRYNTQLKVVDLGPDADSTMWIDEHWKYSVGLLKFKIENFTDSSIQLRFWYNYAF